MKRFLALLGWLQAICLSFNACAAHQVKMQREVVVKRECITAVELTPETECRRKESEEVMHCGPLTFTKYAGCEILEVKAKEGKK